MLVGAVWRIVYETGLFFSNQKANERKHVWRALVCWSICLGYVLRTALTLGTIGELSISVAGSASPPI